MGMKPIYGLLIAMIASSCCNQIYNINQMEIQREVKANGRTKKAKKEVKSDESKLHEVLEIEGVPFVAVRQNETWFVALGKYRLSGQLDSFEECKEFTKDTSWALLIDVMSIVAQDTYKTLQDQEHLEAIKKFERGSGE